MHFNILKRRKIIIKKKHPSISLCPRQNEQTPKGRHQNPGV